MLFFILGNPRSGTSMFRLMLNAHSQITVPPESGFALWFAKQYQNSNNYNENTYKDYVEELFGAKKFETWNLNKEKVLKLLMERKPLFYSELVKLVYKAYANKQNKKSTIFGDKNNYYIEQVEDLVKVFPETKLVFIIRDGRDVAVSYKQLNEGNISSLYKPKLNKCIKEIAKEWTKNADTLRKFVKEQKVPTLFVRYEDLLSSPQKTISRVLDFLGVEYEPQILEFYKHNDEPKDFLQWKGKTASKLDEKNHGKYKKFLTDAEIKEFEIIAKGTLEFFDYNLYSSQLD